MSRRTLGSLNSLVFLGMIFIFSFFIFVMLVVQGVELELRKLEMVVKAIHEKLLLLKDKEAYMRDMSEKTNSRVVWFSMMSLGVCVLASAVQLSHLKGFFRKKKLI
ncbi:putative transmembrane emp24 domain-containing protein [Dioscorea sansibarensis]